MPGALEWPGFFEKLSGRIPRSTALPHPFFIFNEGFRKSRILLMCAGSSRNRRRRTPDSLLPVFLVVAILIKSIPPVPSSTPRSGWGRKTSRSGSTNSARCGTTRRRTVTRSGRWRTIPGSQRSATSCEKTRIDELPQLFNILNRGTGFVGPRPERRIRGKTSE